MAQQSRSQYISDRCWLRDCCVIPSTHDMFKTRCHPEERRIFYGMQRGYTGRRRSFVPQDDKMMMSYLLQRLRFLPPRNHIIFVVVWRNLSFTHRHTQMYRNLGRCTAPVNAILRRLNLKISLKSTFSTFFIKSKMNGFRIGFALHG